MFDLVLLSLLLVGLAFFAYFYFSRANKNSSIDLEKILEREQKTKIEFEKKLELLQNQVITLKENNAKLDSSFKWERPQRVFFPLLGLPIRASNHEQIRSKLLETSFKQYIEMLQRIHQVDEHINPQSWILDHPQYFFFQSLDIDLKSIKIIRIENKAEMEFFSNQTGFNVQKKANTTSAIKEEINLKGKYLKIINDIYAEDFVNLGYSMLKK